MVEEINKILELFEEHTKGLKNIGEITLGIDGTILFCNIDFYEIKEPEVNYFWNGREEFFDYLPKIEENVGCFEEIKVTHKSATLEIEISDVTYWNFL